MMVTYLFAAAFALVAASRSAGSMRRFSSASSSLARSSDSNIAACRRTAITMRGDNDSPALAGRLVIWRRPFNEQPRTQQERDAR
jgi:hypothetical protein